jgi:hypothetical protein
LNHDTSFCSNDAALLSFSSSATTYWITRPQWNWVFKVCNVSFRHCLAERHNDLGKDFFARKFSHQKRSPGTLVLLGHWAFSLEALWYSEIGVIWWSQHKKKRYKADRISELLWRYPEGSSVSDFSPL